MPTLRSQTCPPRNKVDYTSKHLLDDYLSDTEDINKPQSPTEQITKDQQSSDHTITMHPQDHSSTDDPMADHHHQHPQDGQQAQGAQGHPTLHPQDNPALHPQGTNMQPQGHLGGHITSQQGFSNQFGYGHQGQDQGSFHGYQGHPTQPTYGNTSQPGFPAPLGTGFDSIHATPQMAFQGMNQNGGGQHSSFTQGSSRGNRWNNADSQPNVSQAPPYLPDNNAHAFNYGRPQSQGQLQDAMSFSGGNSFNGTPQYQNGMPSTPATFGHSMVESQPFQPNYNTFRPPYGAAQSYGMGGSPGMNPQAGHQPYQTDQSYGTGPATFRRPTCLTPSGLQHPFRALTTPQQQAITTERRATLGAPKGDYTIEAVTSKWQEARQGVGEKDGPISPNVDLTKGFEPIGLAPEAPTVQESSRPSATRTPQIPFRAPSPRPSALSQTRLDNFVDDQDDEVDHGRRAAAKPSISPTMARLSSRNSRKPTPHNRDHEDKGKARRTERKKQYRSREAQQATRQARQDIRRQVPLDNSPFSGDDSVTQNQTQSGPARPATNMASVGEPFARNPFSRGNTPDRCDGLPTLDDEPSLEVPRVRPAKAAPRTSLIVRLPYNRRKAGKNFAVDPKTDKLQGNKGVVNEPSAPDDEPVPFHDYIVIYSDSSEGGEDMDVGRPSQQEPEASIHTDDDADAIMTDDDGGRHEVNEEDAKYDAKLDKELRGVRHTMSPLFISKVRRFVEAIGQGREHYRLRQRCHQVLVAYDMCKEKRRGRFIIDQGWLIAIDHDRAENQRVKPEGIWEMRPDGSGMGWVLGDPPAAVNPTMAGVTDMEVVMNELKRKAISRGIHVEASEDDDDDDVPGTGDAAGDVQDDDDFQDPGYFRNASYFQDGDEIA